METNNVNVTYQRIENILLLEILENVDTYRKVNGKLQEDYLFNQRYADEKLLALEMIRFLKNFLNDFKGAKEKIEDFKQYIIDNENGCVRRFIDINFSHNIVNAAREAVLYQEKLRTFRAISGTEQKIKYIHKDLNTLSEQGAMKAYGITEEDQIFLQRILNEPLKDVFSDMFRPDGYKMPSEMVVRPDSGNDFSGERVSQINL